MTSMEAMDAYAGSRPLSVDQLSVSYVTDQGVTPAVAGVSLTVEPGEFVSVLGPSGCGKSTLLNVIAGLIRPNAGSVSVFGTRAEGAPHEGVGFVFQRPTLLPWLNVIDNVLVPIAIRRRPTEEDRQRAHELLVMVGLSEQARRRPSELSGGMQQRVGIARALIRKPGLLLMDEPFAALDAMTRERMSFDLMDIWGSTRLSVLFITHSIPEAVFLSQRVLMMSSGPGRIVREFTVDIPSPRPIEAMASAHFSELCGEIRSAYN